MSKIEELNSCLRGFDCVLALHLDNDTRTGKYNLVLTLSQPDLKNEEKLVVCFYDVSLLNLSEFGGGLTQFIWLEIEKSNSQHDRRRYQVTEREEGNISFSCEDAEVI